MQVRRKKMPSYKTPPVFSGSFDTFTVEVELWSIACGLQPDKKGPAFALSLSGAARSLAIGLGTEELKKETSIAEILKAIKPLYEQDSVDLKYRALSKLEKLKRSAGQEITSFIQEFDNCVREIDRR